MHCNLGFGNTKSLCHHGSELRQSQVPRSRGRARFHQDDASFTSGPPPPSGTQLHAGHTAMPPKRKRASQADEDSSKTATRSSKRIAAATGDKIPSTTTKKKVKGNAIAAELDSESGTKSGKMTTNKHRASKKSTVQDPDADAPSLDIDDSETVAGPSRLSKVERTTSHSHSIPEPYDGVQASELFSSYADEDDIDTIDPEGFERLCTDAGLSLDGALPLVLAWQVDAKEMGKISRAEWGHASAELEISSLQPLSTALNDLQDVLIFSKPMIEPSPALKTFDTTSSRTRGGTTRGSIKPIPSDPYNRARYRALASKPEESFAKLYMFCFLLAKPEQSRSIDMDTATAFWSVLLLPKYPIMQDVLDFIAENPQYRGVNKDLYNMMLEFCRTVDPSLEGYEADGAWPTLLDDFVAWKRNQINPPEGQNADQVMEDAS